MNNDPPYPPLGKGGQKEPGTGRSPDAAVPHEERSADPTVLYEDNHCLVLSKPAGMLTAGDKTGDPTLLDFAREYLKTKYGKPGHVYLGLVHRLDRPVSGVVVVARTSKAAARLAEQFRTGSVRKVYHAWVEGNPAQAVGELTDWLVKDRSSNVARVVPAGTPGARRAVLGYRVLERVGSVTKLEVRPETGRPHQIRVQLAGHGLPIVGDVKYGAQQAEPGRIALHAIELVFDHPVRHEPVTVQAPEPEAWRRIRKKTPPFPPLETGGRRSGARRKK